MSKKNNAFGKEVIQFLLSLEPDFKCPRGVSVLNPYLDLPTQTVVNKYYNKYYSSIGKRVFLFGINPGRMGAGVTGISFTDPVNLLNDAKIDHPFALKAELSSQFIHEVFQKFGGIEKFTKHFFLSSICPLGFMMDGKNLNYYDIPLLEKRVSPYIVEKMNQQVRMGAHTEIAICLGEGQNYKYFKRLNDQMKWFDQIIPLPHPRFVLQYKRKEKEKFINKYISTLTSIKNILEIS
ncbi:MAG: DUF4918 family protein [Bacteroidetes bacterium]|nr:DUF4918 family protein [Bacteroidota bacterium]